MNLQTKQKLSHFSISAQLNRFEISYQISDFVSKGQSLVAFAWIRRIYDKDTRNEKDCSITVSSKILTHLMLTSSH